MVPGWKKKKKKDSFEPRRVRGRYSHESSGTLPTPLSLRFVAARLINEALAPGPGRHSGVVTERLMPRAATNARERISNSDTRVTANREVTEHRHTIFTPFHVVRSRRNTRCIPTPVPSRCNDDESFYYHRGC